MVVRMPDRFQRAFASDNTAGSPPEIMAAVTAGAGGHAPPYGADRWTQSAQRRLSEIFDRNVDKFAVFTGTAANALCLAALTPPWGGVVSCGQPHQ